MLRRLACLTGTCLLTAVVAGAQSAPPPAAQQARPTVVERPWTEDPTSPYYRAQIVAAERVRPTTPSIDFPVVEAPPDELPSSSGRNPAGAPGTGAAGARPNVLQRPWSDDPRSPHGRAQAVAAERLTGGAAPSGASPYPGRFRSAVPAPFRPQLRQERWRGGVIYPALPFPAIRVR